MLYKTTCPISHYGDRLERGVELELTAEEAMNYADSVEAIGNSAPVVEEPEVVVPVEDMTLSQLKERAKELGLTATGSKVDLVERITLNS